MKFFCVFLFYTLCLSADFYYLVPPAEWLPVPKKHLSEKIEVAFIAPKGLSFRPSLNLTSEYYNGLLAAYIQQVKEDHLAHGKSWKELGYVATGAGKAYLAEIRSTASWGTIYALQAFIPAQEKVFLITAVAENKDEKIYFNRFLNTVKSFTWAPSFEDTLTPLEGKKWEEIKETLLASRHDNASLFQKQWKLFEKSLRTLFPEKGLHWQAMAAKVAYEELK